MKKVKRKKGHLSPLNSLGFIECLGYLTKTGSITKDQFITQFKKLSKSTTVIVATIKSSSGERIVGCGSLLVEEKFVHGCSRVGHIEDVVVDPSLRGHSLGKRIIDELVRIAREANCYKVILDCSEFNVGFYERCGLERKGVQMALYFED